jgi:hypothetical protein
MSLNDRLETLRTRHRTIEEQIDQENIRPFPNPDMVNDLKKQKLRIKDEIALLEHAAVS